MLGQSLDAAERFLSIDLVLLWEGNCIGAAGAAATTATGLIDAPGQAVKQADSLLLISAFTAMIRQCADQE